MEFGLNIFIIFIDQLMLFIVNLLVARQVGPALFGEFTVATNGLLLLATIITLGIDSIIAYYIPKFYAHEQFKNILGLTRSMRSLIIPLYLIIVLVGLSITIIVVALSKIYNSLVLFDLIHPIYLFLWGIVFLAGYNIYIQYFRTIHFLRISIYLSFFRTTVYLILCLLITYYLYPLLFHDNTKYFPHIMLIGFIISYILMVFLSLVLRELLKVPNDPNTMGSSKLHRHHSTIPRRWQKKMYGYMLQDLNKYIFAVVPLFILEIIGNDEHSVGMFSAVISIITLARMAITPLGVIMSPEISEALSLSKAAVLTVMKKYILFCGGVSLIVILLMETFARDILLLYKSSFIDMLPYVRVSLIIILLSAISLPLRYMMQYSRRGDEIGAKLVIGLLSFQFISSYLWIHWLDLLGCIISYVIINVIYLVVVLFNCKKIYDKDFLTLKIE